MNASAAMSPTELIAKAERALGSAHLLCQAGDTEGACNRAYYAMFDAAKGALLATVPDINPTIGKTHNGLIAAFGLHLVKTGLVSVEIGRTLNRAQDIRQIADYTGDLIEAKVVAQLLKQADDFVQLMKAQFVSNTL